MEKGNIFKVPKGYKVIIPTTNIFEKERSFEEGEEITMKNNHEK